MIFCIDNNVMPKTMNAYFKFSNFCYVIDVVYLSKIATAKMTMNFIIKN